MPINYAVMNTEHLTSLARGHFQINPSRLKVRTMVGELVARRKACKTPTITLDPMYPTTGVAGTIHLVLQRVLDAGFMTTQQLEWVANGLNWRDLSRGQIQTAARELATLRNLEDIWRKAHAA